MRMKLKRSVVLAIFAVGVIAGCSAAAFAQDNDEKAKIHPIDAKLKACLDIAKATVPREKCHSEAAEAWEKEVGKAYEERYKAADDKGKPFTEESQDAWKSFREAENKMINGFYSKRRATVDVSVRTIRLYEIDRRRALILEDYPREDRFDEHKPAVHPIDVKLKACLKVKRANMQRAECHSEAARSWEKEVKSVYARLYAAARAKDKTNIKASQDAWKKYSEAEGTRALHPYLRRRGTGYISVRIIILYEINRKRALELDRWRHDLYGRSVK